MAQEDYSAIAASAPANPVPANLAESHPRKILEYAFWKVKDIPFLEHSLALFPPAGQLPPDQVLLVTNMLELSDVVFCIQELVEFHSPQIPQLEFPVVQELEFWFLSVLHRLHLPFWKQFLVRLVTKLL